MKLRNKKTGEIREVKNILIDGMFSVSSLAKLNEEWEDYGEPIVYWLINPLKEKPYRIDGNGKSRIYNDEEIAKFEEVGFLYKTEEEAKQGVERLKAWKRLKDKGLKTSWFTIDNPDREDDGQSYVKVALDTEPGDCNWVKDLNLLFGDEQ